MFLVMTDVLALRAAVAARFGSRAIVRAHNLTLLHLRSSVSAKSDSRDIEGTWSTTTAEYWLFSHADAFVLSAWSGYGRSASVLRNAVRKQRPSFTIDTRSLAPPLRDCTLGAAESYEVLAGAPPHFL